jgi:hypothetical protein
MQVYSNGSNKCIYEIHGGKYGPLCQFHLQGNTGAKKFAVYNSTPIAGSTRLRIKSESFQVLGHTVEGLKATQKPHVPRYSDGDNYYASKDNPLRYHIVQSEQEKVTSTKQWDVMPIRIYYYYPPMDAANVLYPGIRSNGSDAGYNPESVKYNDPAFAGWCPVHRSETSIIFVRGVEWLAYAMA